MSNSRTDWTPAGTGRRVRVGDIPADSGPVRPGGETPTSPGFVDGLTAAVRANPTSAALIGIGAAWLLTGGANVSLLGGNARRSPFRFNRSRRHNADHHFADEGAASSASPRFRTAAAGSGETANAGTIGSAADHVANAASTTAAQGSSGLSKVYEGLGSAAGQVGEAASGASSSVFDASRAAARGARRETEHLQQTLGEFFEDKPLALGILGLAIGAGLAAALPRTEAEQHLMGEASDAAKEQAGAVLAAKIDEAKAAAGRVFEDVSGEVDAQGLTTDGLAATARTVGDKLSTVANAAVESAKNEIGNKSGGSSDPKA